MGLSRIAGNSGIMCINVNSMCPLLQCEDVTMSFFFHLFPSPLAQDYKNAVAFKAFFFNNLKSKMFNKNK